VRINRLIVPLTAAVISAVPLSEAAYAELLIKVDKSTQRMTVTVNGVQLYNWPVTTGGSGYDTPGGAFKPFRMEIDHYSDEYDNAPMPYSIFFTQTGNAIHGTYEQRNLGRAVSHGCVRLSVKNAATLWNLVKQEKMANTSVVIGGAIADAGPPPAARSKPLPLTPDSPIYAAQTPPAADHSSYDAPLSQSQPRYDDNRPPLPFPFSIFGR
jgi:hypothetical protein